MREEGQRRAEAGGIPSWIPALVGGLVVGLLAGLVWAWQIQPLETSNAGPGDLGQGSQQNWVEMVADSLNLTNNEAQARERMAPITEREQALRLGELIQSAEGDLARQQRLQRLAQVVGVQPGRLPEGAATAEGGPLRNLLGCLLGLLALFLLIALAIVFTRMRQAQVPARVGGSASRSRARVGLPDLEAREPAVVDMPEPDVEPVEPEALDRLLDEGLDDEEEPAREHEFAAPDEVEVTYTPALDEFVTRYNYGDDGFDMSFSIETAQTEFLGECGVGISDVLNEGSPQQVTAFEVWLFDKDDIRTVTKVLLSEYAWESEELRSRLAPKGELIRIEEGDTLDLETKSLRVRARIREVEYGSGGPGDKAYFERLVIELTPQQKRS